MLVPVPGFRLREWGTRRSIGALCPTCFEGRLEHRELCPECMGDNTMRVGDTFQCLHCRHVLTPRQLSNVPRLACSHCGGSQRDGWARHHYDEARPVFLHGSMDVRQGELFHTVQEYARKPDYALLRSTEDGVHVADLFFDIDRDGDPVQAAVDTLKLAEFLDEHGAPYVIWFSGSKGFHVQVPMQALGAEPRTDLNQVVYKRLAKKLGQELDLEFDWTIYQRRSMIRMPGVRHGKTGLYKHAWNRAELTMAVRHESGDALLARAETAPSQHQLSGRIKDPKRVAPELRRRYLEALVAAEEKANVPKPEAGQFQTVHHPPCVKRALDEGPPDTGTRHKLVTNLANYWALNGLAGEEFESWAEHVPGASDTPASQRRREAAGALRWSQQHQASFRCGDMQEMGLCNPACPFYAMP